MATPPWSDREILEGCQARDPAAAVALVERYEAPLLRVVVRLVRRWPVAEEIVQDTFYRAFRDIRRIDPDRGARGWLFRVALNLSRDYAQHGSRSEVSAPAEESSTPLFGYPPPDPSDAAVSAEARGAVEAALGNLSHKLREVVLLHYVEGLRFPEISRILNVPEAVLRMRALRARTHLRSLLQDWMP